MGYKENICVYLAAIALGGLLLIGQRILVVGDPDYDVEVFNSASCKNLQGIEEECSRALFNKAVLFFSTQCPSCKVLLSELEFTTQLVGVSSNSLPFLRYSTLAIPIRIPIYHVEGSRLEEFGLRRVPTLILINDQGKISGHFNDRQSILSVVRKLEKESM